MLYFKVHFSPLTTCLLTCILLAYWPFISTYKAHINALVRMTIFPSGDDRKEVTEAEFVKEPLPCERLLTRGGKQRRGLPRGLGAGLSGWSLWKSVVNEGSRISSALTHDSPRDTGGIFPDDESPGVLGPGRPPDHQRRWEGPSGHQPCLGPPLLSDHQRA